MKLTWNWLAELVELDLSLAQATDCLTMGGLEVESVEKLGEGLERVFCADVDSVAVHPNAERLSVCQVRTSADERVQVVCGAPNVRAGMKVAYAAPGALLPGGKRIEAATIRGVASAGMLCSEVELGLGEDAGGLISLPAEAQVGTTVAMLYGLDDTVIEVSVTPNRGDCLSVLGIARELVALAGARLRPSLPQLVEGGRPVAELVTIEIAAPELCARYTGRVIDGIRIGPSPRRVQSRLRAVGLRPINNVVDATNYVMIERGQPLHAFDYDRLPAKHIVVRCARPGERIVTLDHQDRVLDTGDLVVASGETAVAIAGVMGGENSEVSDTTTRILLESAWFDPSSVRRTSKRLGLRSEASYRFERTTDVEAVGQAADRAAEIITHWAGGEVAGGRCDIYPGRMSRMPISLRAQRIDAVLGVPVETPVVMRRLGAFAMQVSETGPGRLSVIPPSYRSDITREIDLVEELARSIGYENIPATLPVCAMSGPGYPARWTKERSLRALLTSMGLHEMVLLSFSSTEDNQTFPGLQSEPGEVEVINPLTQEDSRLRRSLCPGLLKAVRHNLDQGISEMGGFAVGKAFWPGESGYAEGLRLGGVVCRTIPAVGIGTRDAAVDFTDMKGLVEAVLERCHIQAEWSPLSELKALHPNQSAVLRWQGRAIGYLGPLHPGYARGFGIESRCWLFELDLDTLLNYEPPPIRYAELSKFPAVVRDLAIVVEEGFESIEVIRFIRQFGSTEELIEAVELFDLYQGDPIPAGRKSLAFTISYRAIDRTLTDEEVNEVHQRLIAALRDQLPVDLR